jgi:hypothetical protein
VEPVLSKKNNIIKAGIKITETDLVTEAPRKPKNTTRLFFLEYPINISVVNVKKIDSEYGTAKKMTEGMHTKKKVNCILSRKCRASVQKATRYNRQLKTLIPVGVSPVSRQK